MFYEDDEFLRLHIEDMVKAIVLDDILAHKEFRQQFPEFCESIEKTIEDMILKHCPVDKILQ